MILPLATNIESLIGDSQLPIMPKKATDCLTKAARHGNGMRRGLIKAWMRMKIEFGGDGLLFSYSFALLFGLWTLRNDRQLASWTRSVKISHYTARACAPLQSASVPVFDFPRLDWWHRLRFKQQPLNLDVGSDGKWLTDPQEQLHWCLCLFAVISLSEKMHDQQMTNSGYISDRKRVTHTLRVHADC